MMTSNQHEAKAREFLRGWQCVEPGPGDGGVCGCVSCQNKVAGLAALLAKVAGETNARAAELDRTFDLQRKADMRAIERWQAETGKTAIFPDRADMVVWLLRKWDGAEALLSEAAEMIRYGVLFGQRLLQDGRKDCDCPICTGDREEIEKMGATLVKIRDPRHGEAPAA